MTATSSAPSDHDAIRRFRPSQASDYGGQPVRLRCPFCRHLGTFAPIAKVVDVKGTMPGMVPKTGGVRRCAAGFRRCPNTDCELGLFVVILDDEVVASYPPEILDVDTTNLPVDVLASLEEAVKCHSIGCYRAAAIMVRRTLEDVCADRKATGDNLKDRIKALGTKVMMPAELLAGLDELRLLGNDAAHIDAREYDEIGKDEVELAIDVVKALMLAVYQTSNLVDRLRALKKSHTT